MSEVESVGTWVGVVTGIFGVALSIVAIWFALETDKRSKAVSDQTIRSLQKIESAVERSSTDTQGLIKVAWDRLLERDGRPPLEVGQSESAKVIVAGLTAELQAELQEIKDAVAGAGAGAQLEQLTKTIEQLTPRLSTSTTVEDVSLRHPPPTGDLMGSLVRRIRRLPPSGIELVRILAEVNRHLDRSQYLKARNEGSQLLQQALLSLRDLRLIVPLEAPDTGEPVYFFPPATADLIGPALSLGEIKARPSVNAELKQALSEVGYKVPEADG